MRRLFAALLILWAPASAGAQSLSSLRMRPDEAGLDALFDGRPHAGPAFGGLPGLIGDLARLEPPAPLPPPQAAPVEIIRPPSRLAKTLEFLDKALDLEASASAGPDTHELMPQGRWDIGRTLDALPSFDRGGGHGWRAFALDVGLLEAAYGAAMLASYGAGKALDNHRLQSTGQAFIDYASEHGPIGTGPIQWKDPNYGDPWVNEFGHPLTYFAIGRYFLKRGYSPWKAFLGAMVASVIWEYFWENNEIPKSGHDLFFANLLGGLAGSHPEFGLAWGTSLVDPANPKAHYTEFYYRGKGASRRYFFRVEPNGHYNQAYDGHPEPDASQKPFFVDDLSVGYADEKRGLTFTVTGVANNRTRRLSDVGGPGDVLDDVRVGVSVDPVAAWKHLR